MKFILQFISMMLFSIASIGQSNVNIQINHLLDGVTFENQINSSNDLGNDFMIDRLQYYLSGFSIVHDGGQLIEVEDLYVLVNLLNHSDPTLIELGEFNIQNLESVKFYFGVDDHANHADPSLLPSDHPLAPKFPSMHWGWNAGYRFIALEGKSGPSINQTLEFHCIGDEFYAEMEFPVTMNSESTFTVEIDAEYKKLLEGIDISNGIIIHGGFGEMSTLANNIIEKVFSMSGITNVNDSELVNSFKAYPNPVINGKLNINLDISSSGNSIKIQDSFGRLIHEEAQTTNTEIEISNPGIYFLTVSNSSGKTLATRKVVVQ